jgi:hypothetical protein
MLTSVSISSVNLPRTKSLYYYVYFKIVLYVTVGPVDTYASGSTSSSTPLALAIALASLVALAA